MRQRSSLLSNGLTRMIAGLTSVALLAASFVVLFESHRHVNPLYQMPAMLVTVILAILTVYAGSFRVFGHRIKAMSLWFTCVVVVVVLPLLQILPIEYDTAALLNLMQIAPPLWPYSIAMPLLMFLMLDAALPSLGSQRASNYVLCLGLFASMMFLFFASVIIGNLAVESTLAFMPVLMFATAMVPVGVSLLIVLGVVLVHKGMNLVAIILLLITGLSMEWVSSWSYDGPHFIPMASRIPFDGYPLFPILAGTIPGMIVSLAAICCAWQVYSGDGRFDDENPLMEELSRGYKV